MKNIVVFFLFITFSVKSQGKFDVYFDFDKYNLNNTAISKINSWIAENKNYEVTKLYGFCDWKGTNKYNDTLALKRVNEVFDFLKINKVEVKKDIEIRGFGEDFIQSKIQDENRRVTIIFQEKKKIEETASQKLNKQIKSSKKGDLIKLPNIYFYNNSAKIVPKSQESLYDLFCALEENPTLKIEIQGHICCKLPTQIDEVSGARARAIFNFLIQNKIDRKRLTYKGYGVSRPVHPIPEKNSQEEDENRRVEILILGK